MKKPLKLWAWIGNLLRETYSMPLKVKISQNGKCRSEEHTSELQSRPHLVCRLLLEKKKLVGDRGLGRLSASHHGEALIAHAGVSPPLSFARRSGLRLRAASARVCRL